MKCFFSMADYCKQKYNKKLYKLSLNAGFSCPNREDGSGGCIFCSEGGSGEFSEKGEDINAQLERAKHRVAAKAKKCGYIAYYQAYTNTFASPKRLREVFMPAANCEDIDVISIATRPDCLGEEVLLVLEELNRIKPVWVELGLQTANDETARFINRGYKTSVYEQACSRLRSIGIYIITHVIIGLPNEGERELLSTIDKVNEYSDGVKLQLMHVLNNTRLYDIYKNGGYTPLDKDEYFYLLGKAVNRLKGDIAIHRLTGDGDKRILAAPLWSADKKRVLNDMNRYFALNGIVQGKDFGGS